MGDNNSAATATDLNSVPLGSLDYEHLMNYFESLKESAAWQKSYDNMNNVYQQQN